MSEPSLLKEEIKKSIVVEPIKTLIGSLLTLIGMLILAAIPQVRAHIWPAIPKWLLLVLSATFLLVILALIPYVALLRRRLSAVQTDLQTIKDKPVYPYRFNLKWDENFNPLCPHCGAYLTEYEYEPRDDLPDISRFVCEGCGRTVSIKDEDDNPLYFVEAREEMQSIAKVSATAIVPSP